MRKSKNGESFGDVNLKFKNNNKRKRERERERERETRERRLQQQFVQKVVM